MNGRLGIFLALVGLMLAVDAGAVQNDATGCKDHPLFTRMPGYWIHGCAQKQFDSHAFLVGKGQSTTVEGMTWMVRYYPNNDLKDKPSELQIMRNFEAAILKLGGRVIFADKGRQTLQLIRDDKEIWVDQSAEFTGKYGFTIVQKAAMAQDIVANAEVFSRDIRATGHVAVYGINFDTGRADIKPESAQVIGEIAKLLKTDPGLKLLVVGHTDSAGTLDGNLKLSQERAQSVTQALVRDHGIAAARLRPHGCGQFAPVASNDSEEGKAKNRRVELVKQ